MRARGPLVCGLWLVLLATSACGDGTGRSGTETDPPVIVATMTIVGDLTTLVAGPEASVEVLMPVGADPRVYEPTRGQTRRLLEADLIVASGLGLEAGLAEALSDAERRGVPVLRLGENLCPGCGARMLREGSVHHRLWAAKRVPGKRSPDGGVP